MSQSASKFPLMSFLYSGVSWQEVKANAKTENIVAMRDFISI